MERQPGGAGRPVLDLALVPLLSKAEVLALVLLALSGLRPCRGWSADPEDGRRRYL